jgi:hypothetical protein
MHEILTALAENGDWVEIKKYYNQNSGISDTVNLKVLQKAINAKRGDIVKQITEKFPNLVKTGTKLFDDVIDLIRDYENKTSIKPQGQPKNEIT